MCRVRCEIGMARTLLLVCEFWFDAVERENELVSFGGGLAQLELSRHGGMRCFLLPMKVRGRRDVLEVPRLLSDFSVDVVTGDMGLTSEIPGVVNLYGVRFVIVYSVKSRLLWDWWVSWHFDVVGFDFVWKEIATA
ncbi:hypothetical protein M7I_5046 [Glarea lozoyensis 74030]|uniref:Uncharacterized protein n=1 Tax=Glarea lozoyensis (strain ATCC 74030 / MF5533) TaxID=1104152 RepID=H0EQT9_GLAL7|nr:hypothetical protein M7I_5046 [Glarea lozoyensis 74030]